MIGFILLGILIVFILAIIVFDILEMWSDR